MKFARRRLPRDASGLDVVALCTLLTSGCWTIEVGCHPPAWHDPARLPLGDDLAGATALSLRSATAIGLGLGPALIDRLLVLGHAAGPVAGLALHELIINAVTHGNLEVACGGADSWDKLMQRQHAIDESLTDPEHARRAVTIALGWGSGLAVAVVADQGNGYDADAIATRPGLGLRLAGMAGRLDVMRGGRQSALALGAEAAGTG